MLAARQILDPVCMANSGRDEAITHSIPSAPKGKKESLSFLFEDLLHGGH